MAAAAATTLPPPAEAKITAMGTKCLGKELYDFQKEVIYALVYEGNSGPLRPKDTDLGERWGVEAQPNPLSPTTLYPSSSIKKITILDLLF